MSLDRSPSPRRDGGWSSPGLTTPDGEINGKRLRGASPSASSGMNGGHDVTWASAKQRSARISGYPSYQSTNQGFFGRFKRKLSMSLPYAYGGQDGRFAEKEKLGRGRLPVQKMQWTELLAEMVRRMGLILSRKRKWYALVILILTFALFFFKNSLVYQYRRTSWLGGGAKFVIILGANQGGGVMEWKGAREWAIERDSVKNKKKYAAQWGYNLHIVDMSTKKRYAHEWRESWEKVDIIRNAMKKFPDAEWFWWLDLNTFIMEPNYSLQSHIFNDLNKNTYRDINVYNPLKIKHPPNGTSDNPNAPQFVNYLDAESLSPVGDGKPESINLIVPQDCGGFNLGSFFVKRSHWTDRILDIWWDPVFYEQRHMEWEHKEQDALEYIYTNQPWIRPHVAFVPQRKVNAFPNGACGDDRGIHYQKEERDFLVNMAGCEWGRDCWGEMYNFRQLSNRLNRNPWEKFKDFISESWNERKKKEKSKRNQAGMEQQQKGKQEAEKKKQ
ncbi:glycosyltransferase family 34 protein [Pseudocercospora fijiensis CIRAD86]|uniref:Glycosyltransferase family 34 protein n=1 Tax=Pseudocercospora fijiensis (strain CIRAD86) TaxID=383855 RepID=N1QB00_PSEFD|nr:glycosyltransferase family 34 protein [Pseudocercospora fijiensis CIRAD86]EME88277.1 glycosyltransferase family 34 protein [Pseudocercospora fijiensis CIRAD86]